MYIYLYMYIFEYVSIYIHICIYIYIGGDVSVSLGFRWLDGKDVVLGIENVHVSAKEIVIKLGGEYS
jgi:hypothetical protein